MNTQNAQNEKMLANSINKVETRNAHNGRESEIIFARDSSGWRTLAEYKLEIFADYEGEMSKNAARVAMVAVMRLCGLVVSPTLAKSAENAENEIKKEKESKEKAKREKYEEIVENGEKAYLTKCRKNGKKRFANMKKYLEK